MYGHSHDNAFYSKQYYAIGRSHQYVAQRGGVFVISIADRRNIREKMDYYILVVKSSSEVSTRTRRVLAHTHLRSDGFHISSTPTGIYRSTVVT